LSTLKTVLSNMIFLLYTKSMQNSKNDKKTAPTSSEHFDTKVSILNALNSHRILLPHVQNIHRQFQ